MSDNVKTTLLEIIKEAQNLPNEDLEKIEGTNIYVKKGRAKEFDVNAYQYYEYLYNVKITKDMDYITDIYNYFVKELTSEATEYYDAKSYEVASETKNDMARLKALTGSYKSLTNVYNNLAREMENTLKITDNTEKQKRIDEISLQIKENINNLEIIKKEIFNIKNKVNAKVIKVIDEQIALLIKEYTSTTKGTKIAFGLDGKAILVKDKEEYDSLYALKNILQNVKDEEIIAIDNFICVNPHQKETVENILPKINIFKRLKVTEKKEEIKETDNREINHELLTKITNELRRLEEKRIKQKKASVIALNNVRVLTDDLEEYNNLIRIAKILNRAPKSNGSLVWDKAYVLSSDVLSLKSLMNNTKLFKDYNPEKEEEIKNAQENEKVILELENYLDELAKNISNFSGYSNLPIKETKKIGDKSWIVAINDLEEANNIIEIMAILKDVSPNMINAFGIGNVKAVNMHYFEKLITKTKYFANKDLNLGNNEEPDKIENNTTDDKTEPKKSTNDINLKINDDRLKEIDDDIIFVNDLIKNKATDLNKATELLKVYDELKALIKNAKEPNEVTLFDNTYIRNEDLAKYKELDAQINNLISGMFEVLNDNKIKELGQEQAYYESISNKYPEELQHLTKEITESLRDLINYLNKARNTQEQIIEVDGYYIEESDEEIFKISNDKLTKLISTFKEEEQKYLNKTDLNETLNQDKINELNLALESLEVPVNSPESFVYNDASYKIEDKEVITAIDNMLKYLLKARKSNSTQEFHGVYLDSADVASYEATEKIYQDPKKGHNDDNDKHNGNNGQGSNTTSGNNNDNKDDETKTKQPIKARTRSLKNTTAKSFIKDHWRFIVAAGLTLTAITFFISSLPTLAPALIYANSCNALAIPFLSGLFNSLNIITAQISGITYANGAFLMANGAIINAGIAASHALSATLNAIGPFLGLGVAFMADKKLLGKEKEETLENQEKIHAKDYIFKLLSKLRTLPYTIKTNIEKFNYMMRPYPEEESNDYVEQVEQLMLEEHSKERVLTNE